MRALCIATTNVLAYRYTCRQLLIRTTGLASGQAFPCHHYIALSCSAAEPVVTISGVDLSGASHEATVGQSLTLSCNTATADWKKGSVTITSTNTSARVL